MFAGWSLADDKQGSGVASKRACDFQFIIAGECNGTSSNGAKWGFSKRSATIEACNAACIMENPSWLYFGIQNGGSGCFCGDAYGHQGKAASYACNVPCNGDAREKCGGANHNSVWKVHPERY